MPDKSPEDAVMFDVMMQDTQEKAPVNRTSYMDIADLPRMLHHRCLTIRCTELAGYHIELWSVKGVFELTDTSLCVDLRQISSTSQVRV